MNKKIFLQQSSNIFAENRLLKFAVVLLFLGQMGNAYMNYQFLNNQKTILIPPALNTKVEILGNKASDEYIKEFSRYILGLAMSYTPATARSQFGELLTMYSPETFSSAQEKFYSMADTIELTKNISSVFYINKLSVDGNKKEVTIIGDHKILQENMITETSHKTFIVVSYRIENGRFTINSLTQKEG